MVENALGILKEKFPCLNHLRLQPITASNVILACIILHNIEKRLGSEHYTPYIEQTMEQNNNGDDAVENENEAEFDTDAIAVLETLIHQFN